MAGCSIRMILSVMCLLWTMNPAGAYDKEDKPVVEIVTPKDKDVVSQVEEYEGRLQVVGWPVVFVRPVLENAPWWVQPAVDEVVAKKFSGRAYFGDRDTPRGTKFALVVVVVKEREEASKFKTGMTLKSLPDDLPHSKKVIFYRDERGSNQPGSEPRVVKFAGHTWDVKVGRRVGPGPNNFSDAKENVWLDDKGHLHLAITKTEGKWQCAEVVAPKSLGYGEYRWVVAGDLPDLDRHTVLGLFTYESTTREIDFELARWSDPANVNAQFVVQPYEKDSMYRFDTRKAKVLTCSLVWEKTFVRGRCWEGEDTSKEPLADWNYTGRKIPRPGTERARANLWLFIGKPPAMGGKQEVIIKSFQFKPATLAAPKE
jgi:hypothetical protein